MPGMSKEKHTSHKDIYRATADYISAQQKQAIDPFQIKPNVTQTKQNTQKEPDRQ